MFVECDNITQSWLDLQQWLVVGRYIRIGHLHPSDIILESSDKDIAFNFTILRAQFIIYRCKINNKNLLLLQSKYI
jgi:hypothetical protein